jgi:hypothetical protein
MPIRNAVESPGSVESRSRYKIASHNMIKKTARIESSVREGDLLWTPSASWIAETNLTAFMNWLAGERGRKFVDYAALFRMIRRCPAALLNRRLSPFTAYLV